MESWFIVSALINDPCELSSMSSAFISGGDRCSVDVQAIIPDSDGRRALIGMVIDGGGIIPESSSFFGWLIWWPQSINADDDELLTVGDVDDEDDESSFMKKPSKEKIC